MAGDRTVAFIFELVDRFSPMAQRLGQAAANAEKLIMGMGRSANQAERSMNTLAVNQGRVAQSFERSARAAREAERANQLYYNSAARMERMQLAMLERHQAKQQLIASGQLPGGHARGMRQQGIMDMMNAYVGFQMVQGMQVGFGKFLDDANEQRLARTKMGMVGFKGGLMGDADRIATALSGKYKNLSKADILEQLYEGVAIHGDAHHALENVEAQTKLASFLQGFQGGAHGNRSKEWNREVFAAIKSMEMYGVLNTHDEETKKRDIESYLGSMMAMKALYGDQAKIGEYLTTQRRAGMSFYRFDENFRMNVLPALVQEAGGATTGQQAMTAYQTIAGGTKLRKDQMKYLKKYGLLEGDRFAKSFQKMFTDDPTIAAANLLERAEKIYGKNDPKLMDKLLDDLGHMAPNRNMAQFFANLLRNKDNIHKHVQAMKQVRIEMDKIAKGEFFAATTKAGAEASFTKQWHNLMAALGGPMLDPYIQRMNSFADTLHKLSNGLSDLFKSNPAVGKMFGQGSNIALTGLTALMAGAAAGFLFGGLKAGLGMLPGAGLLMKAGTLGSGAAAGGAMLPLAMASSRMIAGMTAAAKAAEVVAPLWLRVARMFSWVGLAGYGAYSLYENRDRLRAFGRDASNVGQNAYYMRLFSGDTMQAINKMLSKYDLPPLDVSSIQKALSTAGQLIMQAAQKLLNTDIGKFIRFQMGLMSFKDFYGDNPRNSPWLDGASEEMIRKVEAKVAAEKIKERNDEFAGYYDKFGRTYWNDPLSTMIQREQNPRFYGSASVIADLQRYGDPDYLAGKGGGYLGGFSASAANIDFGSAARGEGMREIAIRTEVTQATPLNGQVTVRVEGTVNGPVNGGGTANVTGAVQAKSDASRGESAPAGK